MNAMMQFDVRNSIISFFRNGFIKSLEYRITIKSKSEESIAERTKLKGQRFDEIAEKKRR